MIVLIVIFNVPTLLGAPWVSMIFQPEAVRTGQWWRLVTHPFVHVTWYHLMLDASAFLALYGGLLEKNMARRVGYVIASAAGSLVLSWHCRSTAAHGLCGLSGIAHGLMAVSSLELIAVGRGPDERRVGLVSFTLLVLKAGFEALTGRMLFGFLDFGLLGDPVAVSHAGGIIGALGLCLLYQLCGPSLDTFQDDQPGGGTRGVACKDQRLTFGQRLSAVPGSFALAKM